jgi:hypothetical protein
MYFHWVRCLRAILVTETCVDNFVCRLLDEHYLFYRFLNLIVSEECFVKAESHIDSLILRVYLLGESERPHRCILTWTLRHVLRNQFFLKVWR